MKMKAIVYNKYGPPEVLNIKTIDKPVPKDNEVLIKIMATTVHVGDTRMRSFRVPLLMWLPSRFFLGLRKPKRSILGMEVSGIIEDIGKDIKRFKKGDEVFALTGFNFGGYAEYMCLQVERSNEKQGMIALKPSNVSFEEAAAVPAGALTAFAHMEKIDLNKGDHILIYGASGSIGTYAVQLAKYFGATVTGVCSSKNVGLVKSLGADNVIDYTKEDFTRCDKSYDVVFDAVFKMKKSQAKKALKKHGLYDSAHSSVSDSTIDDFLFLKKLIEKNKLKPVIDRCYPMEEIVKAHRYVDKGHKVGNVVITISQQ